VAGPSTKVYWSHGEVLCELQKNECTDISESNCISKSEINVTIASCGKRCVSYKEESVIDSSIMQHGIWTKSDAERPVFPFTDRPGLYIVFEDSNNLLE
jgi:hypothetical protein